MTSEFINATTELDVNLSGETLNPYSLPFDVLTELPAVKAFFYCLYFIIFVIGVSGNVLVCYVVFRNKSMQTVTNLFITNLALSDILLCTFAVAFTPLYLFMNEWVFGEILCHLVPFAQGVSVYISAFTLMFIAIDRFFVIIYPFKARLKVRLCLIIIICIWMLASLLTLPYGIFMKVQFFADERPYCEEGWPDDLIRKLFGFFTSLLQFVLPFFIITFCYLRISCKLHDRARLKPGANSQKKMEIEMNRTRRLNRMLITMVVIFGISWLPLNVYNLVVDFHTAALSWEYLNSFFFVAHSFAMSSTCYNPFLYAWLNENFRKEFKTVLPCYHLQQTQNANTQKQRLQTGHPQVDKNKEPVGNLKTIVLSEEPTSHTAFPVATTVKYLAEAEVVRLEVTIEEQSHMYGSDV